MKQTFFLMSVLISVYEMKQNVKLSRHLSLLGIKKYNSQIFYYENGASIFHRQRKCTYEIIPKSIKLLLLELGTFI